MIGILHRLRRDGAERGMALAGVLILGMVMVVMATTAISVSTSGLIKADGDQDWNGAMAAAYAGIEDYQSRLANDNSYQQYGNPAAKFSTGSLLALPTGSQANPAFGLSTGVPKCTGAAPTWACVAGSDNRAFYRYEVNNKDYASTGVLRVRSTGMVGNRVRSVTADMRQQGFIDFLYFTDYELQDPAFSGDNVATCVKYAWAGRPASCSNIAFGGGDTINGPVHSNDTIRICDATFKGAVTTSNNPATGKRYTAQDSNGNSCSGQVFKTKSPDGSDVGYRSLIGMPSTNSQMKRETRSDLTTTDVPNPGCLYTGPTSIVFRADGYMTVRSPYSKFTRTSGDTASEGTSPPECGTPGAGTGQLGSAAGAVVKVPDKNLLYVQNIPTSATDKNYTAGLATCTQNAVGYPVANEKANTTTDYGCRNGDVFVKGTLNAGVTVASENYVYVTGDVNYVNSTTNILGLVGQNAVFVWNPVNALNGALLSDSGREIDAAIISVAHTFAVQNVKAGGERGTLTINGAIAQKFRGIVHSGNNGYVKDYNYDSRLKFVAPPKFLSPVTTAFTVTALVEVSSAFTTTGAQP